MDPQKRIYWGYLLSSAILLFLFRHKIATKKLNWMTRSSVVDLSWLFVNQLLLKFWIAPFFALQISTILWLNTHVIRLFGRGDFFDIDTFSVSLLFASVLFLVNDFCKFLVHLGFHKMPLLWPFHAVHHSAETLTPLSLYRIHPVEFIVNSLRSFTVGVMVSTLFIYLFANHISVLQIIGVNLFVFIFNLVGSNLRHSPFYLGFGRLERLFISPAQHQIHHSVEVEHYDKNFGSALAIWDGFFNTLILSKTEQVNGFGLDKKSINRQTIKQQWWGVRDK